MYALANTPNFLHAALDKSACAPFFTERRMKFVEPIGPNRKFGAMGHPSSVGGWITLVHLSGCYLRRRCLHSFIPELWAQDNGFDQRIKTIALRGEVGLHGIDQRFIG